MAKKNKEVDVQVDEAEIMPTENAQQPNIEFIRNYYNTKAGTQKYLKTIPKQLKDYVKFI